MTSERKIAANRRNAQRSSGPRTPYGKARASRNAIRHGLAANTHRDPVVRDDINQLALDICGENKDPRLYELALVIAENELMLRMVGAERIAVVERLRSPDAIALARGDNCLVLATAKYKVLCQAGDELEKVRAIVWSMSKEEFNKQLDAIDERDARIVEPSRTDTAADERDEFEAFAEAMPDLDRLGRYKRRALSRRKRAIREYIKIMSES